MLVTPQNTWHPLDGPGIQAFVHEPLVPGSRHLTISAQAQLGPRCEPGWPGEVRAEVEAFLFVRQTPMASRAW